jgi:hypothetical protein
MTQNAIQGALDDAVRHYVKEHGDGSDVVTGWVLTTSVKHPFFPNSDGYITEHGPGLPDHAQLGLLVAAADEKRNTILANILKEDN